MGNAALWFRPEGSNVGMRIDLGRKLQARFGPYAQYRGGYSEALGGLSATITHSGRSDVRLQLTWQRTATDGTDAGSHLRRRLWDLQAHLKRGGHCSLAEDEDYCWATFLTKLPEHKATVLDLHYPPITNKLAADKTPDGREVYTHSDLDSYLTEMRLVTDHTTTNLTVDRRLLEDYAGKARWVLVREAGTYPAMRVPPPLRSQNFLDAGNELVFRLDLPLEEDPDRLEELAQKGGQIAAEDEGPEEIGPTDTFDDPDDFPDIVDSYRL